jgi:hypothetical protein
MHHTGHTSVETLLHNFSRRKRHHCNLWCAVGASGSARCETLALNDHQPQNNSNENIRIMHLSHASFANGPSKHMTKASGGRPTTEN